MRETWKAGLGAIVLMVVLALAAPGTASAQIDCSQCTSSNYCEEMCQRGFHGEYYFDICRNWVYPCMEWTAAAPVPEGQVPSFLKPVQPAVTAPEAPAVTAEPE